MVSLAIPSLAILKVNWDTSGKDYIENFVPFVAQCVISLKASVVSIGDVQDRMLKDFGIRIPQNALRVILNRAAKRDYVRKEYGAYIPIEENLAKLDFKTTRARVLREHNAVIDRLIDFCAGRYNITWQRDTAEEALLSFIAEHQLEILGSSGDSTPIPQIVRPDRKTEFLVNAFIIHLWESDPDGFQYLDIVIKGNMLANVLFYPDISRVQSKFERTEVYCDTAFLIRVLGLEGYRRQEPCKELLDLLYEKCAELRCFRHTLDEVRSILYACLTMLHSGDLSSGHGGVFRHMVDAGYKESDVELELAKLETKLVRFRIKVCEKPEHVEKFQIDESALEQAIEKEIGYIQERARIHDVDCLSAIYRLRRGQDYYHHIENCVALFLTTNSALARASWQFFVKQKYLSEQTVPIALTDHSLTTLLWLKRPLSAPDLPRKHIIADCYAAMEPGNALWKKYLTEISTLQSKGDISSDDYYLLRASLQARSALMELTMGDEEAFVEGTPKEILERVKQSMIAEEAAKVVVEKTQREVTERELEAIRLREQASEQERLKHLALIALRIERISGWLAGWLTKITFGILVVILLVGASVTFLGSLLDITSNWLNYVLPAAFSVFVLFGLLNLIYGTTVKSYSRRLEVLLTRLIESKLKGWLLP